MYGKLSNPFFILIFGILFFSLPAGYSENAAGEKIQLTKPLTKSAISLEEAFWKRHSVRAFTDKVPSWEQVGQLLWAAQGINRPESKQRTVPSAGATYPLELYVILPTGMYRYLPDEHAVVKTFSGDTKKLLREAGFGEKPFFASPCVFFFCARFERVSGKFGPEETPRYVYLEAGHAAQNLLLQLIPLEMVGVPIGAVVKPEAQKTLGIPPDQKTVYILAVGFPKEEQ